ncbi:hypothetical protein D3C87_2146730 [compost metagenome]
MAAGHGVVLIGLIAGERFAVEGDPVFGQQLPVAPTAVAGHQQTDSGQIPGGEVGIG